MSSTGTMVEITPLLPCRPATLSPGCTRRLTAMYTFTILRTPAASSSPAVILRAFSVKRRSMSSRICSRRSREASRLVLSLRLRMMISNHCSRERASSLRGVTLPGLKPSGPPSASLPSISSRTRWNRSSSMMRRWSSRSFFTPASSWSSLASARLSFSTPSRVNTRTSITVPSMPAGTLSEVSLMSEAFSPKIARSSFSSGVNWVSPLGVTLPTRMSPALTSAPMKAMPDSSSLANAASPTLGMSAVISSAPSLVSRAMQVSSSIWMLVKRSSCTSRSEIRMESSKL